MSIDICPGPVQNRSQLDLEQALSMTCAPLSIVLLMANGSDAQLLVEKLRQSDVEVQWQRPESESACLQALATPVDIILADPDHSAPPVSLLLAWLAKTERPIPVVLVCGIEAEPAAQRALDAGAVDYLFKDRLARLPAAILRAVGEAKLRREMEKAEAALRLSEARHQSMLRYSPSVIFLKDRDGRYLMVNPQFEAATGLSSLEVVGKQDLDLFPAAAAQQLMVRDRGVLENGEPVAYEEVMPWGKGDRVFLVSEFPLRGPRDEVAGLAGIGLDVTERRRTELALRQSEEQYRNVVEGALEGLVIHENGTIRFANRSAALLLGCSKPAELIGQNLWESFVAPEARAELQSRANDCLRGEGQPLHEGWPGVRKDGSRVWLQSSVTVITWQGRPALMGYFWDITERKRAEESLRASEELFSKAFHGSPLPVSIVTMEDGRYVDANTSLLRMVGREREDVIGRTAFEMGIWVDASDRAKLVEVIKAHSNVRSFETRLRVKSGEIRDVLMSAEVIELRRERCMIVVTQDITDQRKLEAQLRQAQKMEAVGQLAGGVAHDFNNLLTIIQGYLAVVKDPTSNAQLIGEAAEQITLAADRAAALTRQLLTFSRRQVMQPRNVRINDVIERTGRMLGRLLGEDIGVGLRLAENLPCVNVDPGMIEQALLNLAVNARDAMPGGGRLTISTSARVLEADSDRGPLEMAPGQVVCITVADSGCGIPRENLSRIFEPFFTTKDVGKGTGLGLASAYGIVKQHRGGIRVNSELGQGSTFEIFLPVLQVDKGAAREAAPSAPVRGGTEGILLVEDEQTLRGLVRTVLVRHGYRVFEAESGPTALEVWEHNKDQIDLVLTDMVMPDGLSGRELADQLRRERPELKVVFSSGYSPQVVAQGLVIQPGVNFLAKPYDPRLLARTIRSCLDSGQQGL